MSGGVDSSVAAALLTREGYDCIGMHLHIWSDSVEIPAFERHKFPQKQCCTVEALEKARRTCQRLDIPFYVLNVRDEFKEKVVDYFIETYEKGETPNPCIECNRQIRFGLLLRHAKSLDADFLATGHYVRKRETHENGSMEYELLRAKDPFKDQSYFLYTLTQEILASSLFPIGEYTKPEVRRLAASFGLEEARDAEESQNICFFPDRKYQDFLKRHVSKKALTPGPIETTEGKVIGTHEGLALYTVGQRQGLKLGGLREPLYAKSMDRRRNTLIVGLKESLETTEANVREITFVSDSPPKTPLELLVKIRHPGRLERSQLISAKKGRAKVIFPQSVSSIAAGQSMVFYDGDKVLGGGIVEGI